MLSTWTPKLRQCANCPNTFMPSRPMQRVCGPRCAMAKVRADRKQERVTYKARRKALETIPELKKIAQAACNAYIRQRDKDKGCFVCGKPFPATNTLGGVMDAGHVFSRGAADHLRFEEDNIHGECKHCNSPNGAKPHQIKAGAIRRIGQKRYDELDADHAVRKWTKDGLREIAATYRAKLKQLMEVAG